jgi:hypothetical protein
MSHHLYSTALAALVISQLTLGLGASAARAEGASYFGRWTVSETKPAFSSKGKLYKTIDIAPCGKDFCGVSVGDKNECGKTLFRFFTIHANDTELIGHGRWGNEKKKLIITYNTPEKEKPFFYLGLGDSGMIDLSGREGSLPTFEAPYKLVGAATCVGQNLGS